MRKRVLQRSCNSEKRLILQGSLLDMTSCIVSYAKARKMMGDGCQAFVASLVNSIKDLTKLVSISVVSEFLDVFSELLIGLHQQERSNWP